MSIADRSETQGRGEAPACGADELKGLLQRIATQIADTDRRHSETLTQMKDRLGTLGDEARSVRMRVPSEFAPAFERIEEGMALLAERIAGAGAAGARSPMQPWASMQARGEVPTAAAVTEAAAAAAPAVAPAPAPAAAEAPASVPPALRSASAGQAAAAPKAALLDPFDFIDQQTKSTTGEWEPEDADALARIYESGAAGLPRQASQGSPVLRAVAAAAAAEGSVQRQWLDERLNDIAERLHASIKDARADVAISALGQRFDQFEQRFDAAMQDVATRSDVEGLRLVEAHISELATHLEQTEVHLRRLDTIEGQLVTVVDRLSDDRFAALIEHAAPNFDQIAAAAVEHAASRLAQVQPAQPIEPDYERLADLAAERAAVQVAGLAGARGGDEHRLEDLKGLLEGFITERRQGDEQTASMLDTMQQAMIRVLDRMDALESAQARPAAVVAPAVERAPPRYPAGGDAGFEPRSESWGEPRGEARMEPRAEPMRAPMPPMDPAMVPRVTRTGGVSNEPPSIDLGPAPMGAGEPRSAQPRTKEDFIAAARRAARQAANEPPAPIGPEGAAAKGKAKTKAGEPAPVEKKSVRSLFSLGRKSVLASSIVVIVAMAGALAVMRAEKPAQAISEATQPAEANMAMAVEAPRLLNSSQSAAEGAGEASEAGAAHGAADASEAAGGETSAAAGDAEAGDAAPSQTAAEPVRHSDSHDAGMVPGITLQSSRRAPTLHDLNRLREQQDLAALSSRLGAAAAHATPASLLAEQRLGAMGAAGGDRVRDDQAGADRAGTDQAGTDQDSGDRAREAQAGSGGQTPSQRALALPPATVGPMSLRVAAAKGDPSAEFEVGARLAEGRGIDQNFAEAIHWYQRAAQQGFAQAQYRLATFYERGLGTKADLARAAVWYKRAAEQGNVKAMHNLAVLSASRRSGAPDYATAAKWFAEAADRGLADSQFNLAVLYESGLGVTKDLRQALKWMTIAARAGDAETVKRRERLRREMGRSDFEAAEALIRDWHQVPADPLANDARAAGEAWKRRTASANG